MPQLIWSGTDEQEQYHDEGRNVVYWPSERPVTLPEPVAEEYLEHDGWSETDDSDHDSEHIARVLEEHDQARAEADAESEDDDSGTGITSGTGGEQPNGIGFEMEIPSRSSQYERPTETGAADPAEAQAEAEPDEEPDPEARIEQATAGDDEFDATGFIDGSWNSVVTAINAGEADEHLDAVEEAERDRNGKPREASVLTAIEERRDQITTDPVPDTDLDAGPDPVEDE